MDEKEKYERYWEIPGERNKSPGMRAIEEFAEEARARGLNKILDLGCGMGKTAAYLLDQGFDVTATDIAYNCLNPELQEKLSGRFTPAPAWNLPFEDKQFDCTFSCDVLEHIPLELVPDTLAEMARVSKTAYLEIASFDRSVRHAPSGAYLHVHMAVQSPGWWIDQLRNAGWKVSSISDRQVPKRLERKTPGYAIWSFANA